MPKVNTGDELVDYVVAWKWKLTRNESKGWETMYVKASNAERAITNFHGSMAMDYTNYSKKDVVIKEVWPNG